MRTDNQGGLISDLVYLPDKTKKRQVRPYAFLATNKGRLTWTDDGTKLINSESEADSTTVPKAMIGVLEAAAKEAFKAGMFDAGGDPVVVKPSKPNRAPAAYLFKVVKRNGEWGLIGASTSEPLYKPYP